MRVKLLISAVLLCFGFAVPALALPPEPASTAESNAARNIADKIVIRNFYTSDSQDPETVKLRSELFQKLEAGCRRDDAWACSQIANIRNFYERYPESRRARQQFAVKAADLYAAFCDVRLDTHECDSMNRFLQSVSEEDKKNPAFATDGLNAHWLRLARAMGRSCSIPSLSETSDHLTDEQFEAALDAQSAAGKGYALTNCETGLKLLDARMPAEAKPIREMLCSRDRESACRALGRLSQSQTDEEAALAKACEGGDGKLCATLASKWMYRTEMANYGAETRKWSQKSCASGFALGCLMSGAALAQKEMGPPDYYAAADAFGKACKTLPATQAESACKNEKMIRDAIAASNAKAAAAPTS